MQDSSHIAKLPPAMQQLLVCAMAVLCWLPLSALAGEGESGGAEGAIGEVSLVLGEALIRSDDGGRRDVARGMVISVGDEIETRANGHVHIRFIDNALVSVRPNSRLSIDRYEFDASRTERSAVKFSLSEGVTRAISGEAAKAARDRFRLNTPVAAIGVRGTDFVVGAIEGTTRAQVNEGAIVMAPYSEACSVEAFGPCLANALELSGDTLQLAALDADESVPRMLPPEHVRRPDFMQEEVKVALARVSAEPAPAVTQVQPGAAEAVAGVGARQSDSTQVLLESTTNPVVQNAELLAAQPVDPTDEVALEPELPPDFTPAVALTTADIGDRQLVWGYYAETLPDSNRIALSRNQAAEGRSVSIGNLDYGLFRSGAEDGSRTLRQDLGIVGFQLNSAQAVYNSATGIVAMAVRDGNLDINFQDDSFFTALTLDHALTGQVNFAATGRLFDGGFFRALEATQKVSGAVSFDGSEAGYLFERQLENGLVSGLTLWGSK
jgi:hypothetical protein